MLILLVKFWVESFRLVEFHFHQLDQKGVVRQGIRSSCPNVAQKLHLMGISDAQLSNNFANLSLSVWIQHEDRNDVYDIGVILLEIILGRSIMFYNEVGIIKDLVSIFFSYHKTIY